MAEAGHNSGTTEADQRAARRMIFVEKLLSIQAKMEPLLKERKQVRAEAKGEFKLSEIDAAIRLATMEDQSIFVDEIKELIAIAQAFNALPPGEQGSLFPDRRDADEKAFDDGKTAGINGKSAEVPYGFKPEKWVEGWHAGQAIRRDELQRDMEARNAASSNEPGSQEHIAGHDADDPFAEAAE